MARTIGTFSKARPAKDVLQRAWQAMRILRQFTAYDVRATAVVGENNLRNYIKILAKTGYLREIKPKTSGKSMGHAVWQLVRDSGPKHPIARRDRTGVYDPNTGKAWGADGQEIKPAASGKAAGAKPALGETNRAESEEVLDETIG